MGFSLINYSFGGTHIYGNPHIFSQAMSVFVFRTSDGYMWVTTLDHWKHGTTKCWLEADMRYNWNQNEDLPFRKMLGYNLLQPPEYVFILIFIKLRRTPTRLWCKHASTILNLVNLSDSHSSSSNSPPVLTLSFFWPSLGVSWRQQALRPAEVWTAWFAEWLQTGHGGTGMFGWSPHWS